MSSNVLDTLGRVGLPPALIDTFKGYEDGAERIRAQRYQSAKEADELVKLAEGTAQRLVVQFAEEIQAASAQRDADLRAVDDQERQRTQLPAKGEFETDSEYQAKLLKRSIEESRRAAAMTLHVADVHTIATATSANVILEILDDAIASAPPEAVKRIGRMAETRAAALAAAETRDGGAPGEAFQAHLKIQDVLRRWRGQLPEVQRERIRAAHTSRAMDLRNNVTAAARIFHLEQVFKRALMKAALQPSTE